MNFVLDGSRRAGCVLAAGISTGLCARKVLLAMVAALVLTLTAPAKGDLARDFSSPPPSAKPSCYWLWLNNLTDKQGITRDLEEFKAKGMGGAMIFPVSDGNMPQGPAFLSSAWRDLYKHALQEAARLGLEMGVGRIARLENAPGLAANNVEHSVWFLTRSNTDGRDRRPPQASRSPARFAATHRSPDSGHSIRIPPTKRSGFCAWYRQRRAKLQGATASG